MIWETGAMWRLPGIFCRALNRLHANVPGCVHGEAEALNPSSLIPLGQNAGGKSSTFTSSGSQHKQNGKDEKKKEKYQSFTCKLPQYTVFDAFRWGAAAAFFWHLAGQISRSCSLNTSKEDKSPRILRSHIVPKTGQAYAWNGFYLEEESSPQAEDTSHEGLLSGSSSGNVDIQFTTDQDESEAGNWRNLRTISNSTPTSELDSEDSSIEQSPELHISDGELEESVQVAASQLLNVTTNSMPVVLNIFGIVNARDNADYSLAFRCFLESAKSGYSKAQYNTAVCYEQGRGVTKDMTKAAEYYLLAANRGHRRAQYRFARYLLHSKANPNPEDTQIAVQMLQEAAHAGLKEAQSYLGVLYSRDTDLDPQKAVRYLWMAAENGDVQSRYHLAVCYEKGFGVPEDRWEAQKHYERAAKTGHRQAQLKLQEMQQEEGLSSRSNSLRGAASSPCLPVLERSSILTRGNNILAAKRANYSGLPYSMSTGNLLVMSSLDNRNCNLVPLPMKNCGHPMASLRAIGVG
ncbi:death ligand signal enhancer isoform X2 [Bombina bombina]|uniref:death ligand signal enhancer isoform X2 n=1 Tax=Bombina bombina TaxID=8345 RepID=UPI00235B19F3|nr:death ligand signal enhancer isoform X2 [Bombina bombina]